MARVRICTDHATDVSDCTQLQRELVDLYQIRAQNEVIKSVN